MGWHLGRGGLVSFYLARSRPIAHPDKCKLNLQVWFPYFFNCLYRVLRNCDIRGQIPEYIGRWPHLIYLYVHLSFSNIYSILGSLTSYSSKSTFGIAVRPPQHRTYYWASAQEVNYNLWYFGSLHLFATLAYSSKLQYEKIHIMLSTIEPIFDVFCFCLAVTWASTT